MILKYYQEKAIEELLEKSRRLLGYSGGKKLVFRAPTGSGKTIMMAEYLKRLIEDREVKTELSFIWAAPRQLHIQSKDKLDKYYEISRALHCSYFDDLDGTRIRANEMLFFNWESINKADNIYIRENQRDNNLSNVLINTREEGRKIILIIDECHYSADAPAANKLRNDINADLTIEVSATPVLIGDSEVGVTIEEVKAEGMIKKAVLLNPGFDNYLRNKKIKSDLSKCSEEFVLEVALKKREQLVNYYKKEKVNINPLVLVQLPDRKTSLEDIIKDKVIKILRNKHKITTGNGKLAIHLSGHHENLDNIATPDNEAEVLIFKQALALGWDCPRAQILVLFRDWKSLIFSIQTIGRIMRMPDPEQGHYDSQDLNYGYVYTNLENIEIKEDIAKDYIAVFPSKRKPGYKPINLLSYYSKRHREKTRLSPLFIEHFLSEAKKYKLSEKINLNAKKLNAKIITDWKAEDVDKLAGETITGQKEIHLSNFDLQKAFDFFVRNNLTPFHPEDRSIGRVKEAIYGYFRDAYKFDYKEKQEEIIRIILSNSNIQHFVNVIDLAKRIYTSEVEKREAEIASLEDWNIPCSLSFNSNYTKENKKKSIMRPFYSANQSNIEKEFIKMLERSPRVDWWFKNGDRDATFFAVPYKNGEDKPFYVDFIVKFKKGAIGLFDTKSGMTLRIAGPKIEGLFKYIKNEKGKKLFGGIVSNTDSRNYRGRWIYFDRPRQEFRESDLTNWNTLVI